MNRQEKVLSYIKSKGYLPLKLDELAAVLCVPAEDIPELEKILSELTEEGKITKTKRGRYAPGSSRLVTGRLSCSSYGFFAFVVSEDEEDVYVHGDSLGGALDGDRVTAQIDSIDSSSKKAEGHIVKILEHANSALPGVVKRKKHGVYIIHPDSQKIYTNISVKEEDMLGAAVGDRVIVEITAYPPGGAAGIVTKILGDSEDLRSSVAAILYTEGITEEFAEDTIAEAEAISDKITERDLEGRLDLRSLITFTIDGDDARDFDDAVSLEINDDGSYRLGVHIADVSHYVKENSPLDTEAFKRGTSIYLPDRVIPMLPKRLSNGICSLNPHEDRLTLTVFMNISKSGAVQSHELHKSVINSKERMTYSDTAALLENPSEKLLKRYGYLLPVLKNMKELSDILRKRRTERGSIDFDFPESDIIVNDMGEPIDIRPEKREISHKIIEDFMLCANETVAEYAFWAEIPFVYRVHEPPSYDSMRDFQKFISAFGIGIKEKFSESEPIHPKALQQVLDRVKGTDEEHMISVYTLRSLMKAEYKAENLGHFGLAAKYYCHFTSPIRRYPDLAIHRILKDFISGKSLDKYSSFAEKAARRSSDTERTAQDIERDVDDLMKTYFMSQYIGYIFEAKISSVTEFGIFAELENSVEGLIRIENIKDDYYIFDSENRTLTGRNSAKVYKIGDKIDVAVARCDLELRRIDFIPAENADMSDIDMLQKREYKHRRERQKKINHQKRRRRR